MRICRRQGSSGRGTPVATPAARRSITPVNALSYVSVIIALLVITPTAKRVGVAGTHSGILDALRYVRQHQQLWMALLMMAGVGLLSFNFGVVLPPLARDSFHGGGGTYGLLSTMLSVGSVAGSLAVGLIHHLRGRICYLRSSRSVRRWPWPQWRRTWCGSV